MILPILNVKPHNKKFIQIPDHVIGNYLPITKNMAYSLFNLVLHEIKIQLHSNKVTKDPQY